MKGSFRPHRPRRKRSLEPVAWGALPALALAIGVLASGVGVDLLLIALAGLILFTLDRTLGDWMAEKVGPIPASVAFSIFVMGCTWYFVSYSADDFFAKAEKRGYRTAYYQRTPATPEIPSEGGSSTAGASVQSTVAHPAGGGGSNAGGRLSGTPGDQPTPVKGDSANNGPRATAARKSAPVPGAQAPPPTGPSIIASASRIVLGTPARTPAPTPSRITLTLSPAQVLSARRAVFQVVVTAEGRPVTEGSVDFTVNGTGAGRVPVDSRGIATTAFATHIPGTYEIRARFSGTTAYEPSASADHKLTVLAQ